MSARKEIARYGAGHRRVRVVLETVATASDERRKYARVLWTDPVTRRRRYESFPADRTGQAQARVFAEEVERTLREGDRPLEPKADAPELTLADVWDRYTVARRGALRQATWTANTNRWRLFMAFAKPDRKAHTVTREMVDDFVAAERVYGRAPNQIKLAVQVVRLVFRWAVERDLILPTKVASYQPALSRDELRSGPKMQEFRATEREKIVAMADPRDARTWRPWVFSVLAAHTGRRQKAIRHLRWSDVDFAKRQIVWPAAYDKTHEDKVLPIEAPVIEALWVAYGWRLASGYTGQWVLFGAQRRTRGLPAKRKGAKGRQGTPRPVQDTPWTYQAYNRWLVAACAAGGVPRAKYQAAHAFRRGVAGDIADAHGIKSAADYIGDKSIRVVEQSYVLQRDDKMRALAATLSGKPANEVLHNATAPDGESGAAGLSDD